MPDDIVFFWDECFQFFRSGFCLEDKVRVVHELLSHKSLDIFFFLLYFYLFSFTLRKSFRFFLLHFYFFLLVETQFHFLPEVAFKSIIVNIIVEQASDLIDGISCQMVDIFSEADIIFVVQSGLYVFLNWNWFAF